MSPSAASGGVSDETQGDFSRAGRGAAGRRLTNIDLADDDIVGEGPFNMVFASGRLLDSRGYLLTPGEIRACVDTTLAETDYTARPAA